MYRQKNLDGSHKMVYVTECLNVSENINNKIGILK